MQKLRQENNSFYITKKNTFTPTGLFKPNSIKKAFDFAYNMSFGEKGAHRDHRSGGNIKRKNGEIFINTFQGKLAEFGVYNVFYKNNIQMPVPDLETYGLGKWDSYDFEVNNRKIAVKSTKHYGNLLLLETKDWNENGEYLPNLDTDHSKYDFFILVRIDPDSEKLMKANKFLYFNELNKDKLEEIILNKEWKYDIPGFISNQQLVYVIRNNFILPQASMLNGTTKMDAENYYIQSGDMIDINTIFEYLR